MNIDLCSIILTEAFHNGTVDDCIRAYQLSVNSGLVEYFEEKLIVLVEMLAHRHDYSSVTSFREFISKYEDDTSPLRKLCMEHGYIILLRNDQIPFSFDEFFSLLQKTTLKGVRVLNSEGDHYGDVLDITRNSDNIQLVVRDYETFIDLLSGSPNLEETKICHTTFECVSDYREEYSKFFSNELEVNDKLICENTRYILLREDLTDIDIIRALNKEEYKEDAKVVVTEGVDVDGNFVTRSTNYLSYIHCTRMAFYRDPWTIEVITSFVKYVADDRNKYGSTGSLVIPIPDKTLEDWMLEGVISYELNYYQGEVEEVEFKMIQTHKKGTRFDDGICFFEYEGRKYLCSKRDVREGKTVIFLGTEYNIKQVTISGDYYFFEVSMIV